jgi:aspartate ammonia-lyase
LHETIIYSECCVRNRIITVDEVVQTAEVQRSLYNGGVSLRREHDALGERDLPAGCLHGIHTLRALDNFQLLGRPVHPGLARAFGAVKLAAVRTNRSLGYLDTRVADALDAACQELIDGRLAALVVVDALQGGAGTSANMNVNEVLANRALELLGASPGSYQTISPVDHVNLHQSTNDVFPTALRVAALWSLRQLEPAVVALQEAFQEKERAFAHVVKVGRTEMQDAVLTTLGREMSAYAEALNRDRWRLNKCEERLRVVNLGGTAIGTGLAAPRHYIFRVVDALRDITGLGVARAENMIDATQNADVFVEVSGLLKALAATLIKICGDLRLLSSGPESGLGEIRLRALQAGSSIMPGKVNPVVPEAVTQASLLVIGHDASLTMAAAMGSLELNPFLPLVAHCLLESFDLLARSCESLCRDCVRGIEADEARCRRQVENATASATALVPRIGYERAGELVAMARRDGRGLKEAAVASGWITAEEFDEATSAEAVCRLGFRESDGR